MTKVRPWHVTDELWETAKHFWPSTRSYKTEYRRSTGGGRKMRHEPRLLLEAMAYVLRSGCSWRDLPINYPPWGTVYRWLRRLIVAEFFESLHHELVVRGINSGAIDLGAVVIDSATVRAVHGGAGVGYHPKEKNKKGIKRHCISDKNGLPLVVAAVAANIHDSTDAQRLVSALPMCGAVFLGDKGYDSATLRSIVVAHGFADGIMRRRIKNRVLPQLPPMKGRSVIEALHAHMNNFRRLRVCYERLQHVFVAFMQLTAVFVITNRFLNTIAILRANMIQCAHEC